MTRDIVLGNQRLLVNIDRWLQVRDIYYPRVGQYNHLVGHAHRIAVLEGDHVSWLNDDEWERIVTYQDDTLLTESSAKNKDMGLSLSFSANVYCAEDIFFRRITIKNERDHERTLRMCFHQDFHLYADGIGDTALYDPERDAVVHYKRSVYLLLGLLGDDDEQALHDYSIGEHVNVGWELDKNPVAQGEVDSLLATDLVIGPQQSLSVTQYLCAGKRFEDVHELQDSFCGRGPGQHVDHAQSCQLGFLDACSTDLSVLDDDIAALYRRSLLIIKTQMDEGGAIIAANDSDNLQFNKDTYSYMWPRDGALVAIALIRAGYGEMTKPFFTFCRDALYEEGCLLHKYNPDGTLGSSWHPWVYDGQPSLPIQEDETALVLHALSVYLDETGDEDFVRELYEPLIKPMAEFMWRYRHESGLPRESYDLWEERRGVFTYTTSAVLAGLRAADRFGELVDDDHVCHECEGAFASIQDAMIEHLWHPDGYFRRGASFEHGEERFDDALDASAYATFAFGAFAPDDDRVAQTMQKVREWLWVKTDVGGIARYAGDSYHQVSDDLDVVPGNPWLITTLWYAKWVIAQAEDEEALEQAMQYIRWALDNAQQSGVLPEQVDPFSGDPLSVSPLTWSHAEFVDAVTSWVRKRAEIRQ